jgi:lysophospholipase L1-like esterase
MAVGFRLFCVVGVFIATLSTSCITTPTSPGNVDAPTEPMGPVGDPKGSPPEASPAPAAPPSPAGVSPSPEPPASVPAAPAAGAPSSSPGIDPNTTGSTTFFIGRFTTDSQGPACEWPNSAIVAHFTGTGVAVTLGELSPQISYPDGSPGGNIYQATVDEGAPTRVATQPATATYSLATGLAPGLHTVSLVKLTEPRVGKTRFLGFTVEAGQLTPWERPLRRQISVIGDSISAGYGLLGGSPSCGFSPSTEDASKTYGAVAAQSVQADFINTSYSAKGLIRNEDGTTSGTMPNLYKLTVPSDSTSAWDPNGFIPDVVVVNLGTNDFATGIPPAAEFQQAYAALLRSVRGSYPRAYIFCALGPMLSDSEPAGQNHLSVARGYIQQIVQEAHDPRVSFIEFTGLEPSTEGCNGHPNEGFHRTMGGQLARAIQLALGW